MTFASLLTIISSALHLGGEKIKERISGGLLVVLSIMVLVTLAALMLNKPKDQPRADFAPDPIVGIWQLKSPQTAAFKKVEFSADYSFRRLKANGRQEAGFWQTRGGELILSWRNGQQLTAQFSSKGLKVGSALYAKNPLPLQGCTLP